MGRGTEMTAFKPSADEYIKLQQKIYILDEKYDDMHIEWGDPLDHLSRMPINGIKKFSTYSLEIRSDGKLMISSYLPVVCGDLKEHSLKEYWEAGYKGIWADSRVVDYVKNIYSTSQLSALEPMAYTGKDIDILIPIGEQK